MTDYNIIPMINYNHPSVVIVIECCNENTTSNALGCCSYKSDLTASL